MKKSKITKGEKRLIGAVAGSLALILSGALYRYYLNIDPVLNIPKPVMPSPNAYDFYVKAGKAHEALWRTTLGAGSVDPVTDPAPHPNLSLQQLKTLYPTAAKEVWVRKNASTLQLLRQGFKYSYRQPPTRSFTTLLPFLAQYRSLARLLTIESHARSERGNWTGASRSALDTLHLGHDTPRGSSFIGSLVGCGINAIGRKELQIILPHLDAVASRVAATRIEKLEAGRISYAETLQEEKWMNQASWQEMMHRVGWRTFVLKEFSGSFDIRTGIRFETISKSAFLADYTRYMNVIIKQARKPYKSQKLVQLPNDPINAITPSDFTRGRETSARDETANKMLAVQFALRAFKLEHGTFPMTLNDLVPSYLQKVPLDPYDGNKTLHYRKTGNTYVLYSIGPDGKDDGGKPIDDVSRATPNRPDARYTMQPDSKGDYVAGVNR